jgi:hypothetical protein
MVFNSSFVDLILYILYSVSVSELNLTTILLDNNVFLVISAYVHSTSSVYKETELAMKDFSRELNLFTTSFNKVSTIFS